MGLNQSTYQGGAIPWFKMIAELPDDSSGVLNHFNTQRQLLVGGLFASPPTDDTVACVYSSTTKYFKCYMYLTLFDDVSGIFLMLAGESVLQASNRERAAVWCKVDICPPGAPIFSFYGPSTPIDRVIVDTVLGDS